MCVAECVDGLLLECCEDGEYVGLCDCASFLDALGDVGECDLSVGLDVGSVLVLLFFVVPAIGNDDFDHGVLNLDV